MLIIQENQNNAIEIALEFLRAKKAIIFATDTLYGLAVDASSYEAVENLYKLKNRDINKPIAIFVKDLEVAKNIFYFDQKSLEIANKFLPGSLTMVLKTRNRDYLDLASNLNNDEFLGFRIVDKKFINNLFDKFSGILAVTSANISGNNPANNISEIKKYFANEDILVIEGDGSHFGAPSTVIKVDNGKINILRQGIIPFLDENF